MVPEQEEPETPVFVVVDIGMTLYADRVVDRSFGDGEVRASMFGSLNPLYIFTFAPLFAALWVWLAKRGWEPSTPTKFALEI